MEHGVRLGGVPLEVRDLPKQRRAPLQQGEQGIRLGTRVLEGIHSSAQRIVEGPMLRGQLNEDFCFPAGGDSAFLSVIDEMTQVFSSVQKGMKQTADFTTLRVQVSQRPAGEPPYRFETRSLKMKFLRVFAKFP